MIDTTNPPGNEIAGARFLVDVLNGDGLASEVVESTPGRASLRATLHRDVAGDGGGVMVRALLVATVVVFAAAPAAAQPGAARVCAPGDLAGTWDVVDMSAAFPIDRNEPYYYPHQRFVFEAGGSVRHVTSTKPFTPTEWRPLIAGPAMSTWSLDDRGQLIVTRPTGQEGAICTFGLQPVGNLRTGDVVLTYFKGGQPALKRVLRKNAAP